MQEWLRDAGYVVHERGSSRAAAGSPVDLVILATQISTLQTLEVVRTMRVIYPTTAFLVLSSHPERSSPVAGAAPVLLKPLTREKLIEAVRALI